MINGELIVDNFAGGGGASTGIEMATGISVEKARLKAVEDACVVACEALKKHIPKKVNNREEHADYIEDNCPDCDLPVCDVDNYCSKCGCLLDWSE